MNHMKWQLTGAVLGVLATAFCLADSTPNRPTNLCVDRVCRRLDAPQIPTFWAYDFIDSVGVNTHIRHLETFYGARFELMKERLATARIRHIRDGAMDNHGNFFSGDQAERYRDLGRAGIGVTLIFRTGLSKEFVQGFPQRVSPAFEAYELPNEFNLQSKFPWVETLQSWMPVFSEYIRNSPMTAVYPIVGPSLADLGDDPFHSLGSSESYFDYGNLHKYYRNHNPGTEGYGGAGKPPCGAFRYGSLSYVLCHARKVSGSKPMICTEAGYGSNPAAGKQVTEGVQAKYVARMLMLHLKAGIRRTFIYQLADSGDDGYGSYGLLDESGAEKPAFRLLANLMRELEDSATTKPPTPLAISINGQMDNLESALFQKTDGSYRLVIWLEKPSYDVSANQNIGAPQNIPAQVVTITLPDAYHIRRVVTFEDSGSQKEVAPPIPGSTLDLPIGDNLTIVDIPQTLS